MDLSTLMPQQLQIVKTLDRPLFVSAGAGSGKTFTLTRRIVYALSPESGPFVEHLDQVLAITFTKDAAAEIRDRVRRALIDEGMDEEALTVDDAWISTIHGMCSRILRAHALELGIDPEFTVLTDTDELMDQAVEHVLARATAPDAAPELAASLKALYAWYPMAGEGGSFGAGTTIKGLVRELGRDPQRGQAIIYGTTNAFLEKFGLRSTRDLPDLEQFAPDEQSRQFTRERLSGRSIQSTLEEQAEDLDEERELLDTDIDDVEAVGGEETLPTDDTAEDTHDED